MVLTLLQVWEGMSGRRQFKVLFVTPSFTDWTPGWEPRTLNFTVSALRDCDKLESLEKGSATLRTEGFVVARSS